MIGSPPCESVRPDQGKQSGALAFFQSVQRAYDRAETVSGGPVERWYTIAGAPVRLRAANLDLLSCLTPALGHRASAPEREAALTVSLWESAASGVALPPPAWGLDDFGPGGEIRGYNNGRIRAAYQLGSGILSVYDSATRRAVYSLPSSRRIPLHERAAPLRTIFQWWGAGRGLIQAHAGAVGLPQGGVLLAGGSGAGKSNSALACLESPLFYASDDFCLLSPAAEPAAYSLYSSGKARTGDLARLPFLRPMVSNPTRPADEKALFLLNEHRPERLISGFPLRAILLPRVSGRPGTALRPCTAAVALAALAPSSVILAPSSADATFHALARLVRQLPCFYLELGTDPASIADAILRLLARLVPQH